MVSQTFSLGEDGERSCLKMVVVSFVLIVVGIGVGIGIYAYRDKLIAEVLDISGCGFPQLDPNSMSNWTHGSDIVAFSCFPNYFLDDGNVTVSISKCDNEKWQWTPPPPNCNFLPVQLDCMINHNNLVGSISMWQKSLEDPAHIYGIIDFEKAVQAEGHFMQPIIISKSECNVHRNINATIENYNISSIISPSSTHLLAVNFTSNELKAFKPAEVHINMIFLHINATATIISVKQGDITLVQNAQ